MYKRPIIIILILFIISIMIIDAFMPEIFIRNHYIKHTINHNKFQYLIIDSPKETPKTFSYIAKITAYYDENQHQWNKTTGKIKIYIPKYNNDNIKNKLLKYGDIIISSDSLQTIHNFDSSSSFNYVKYMRHNGIYHQVFIHNFTVTDSNQGNILISKAKQTNSYLHNRLQQTNIGQQQKYLASALLLGNKKDIDPNIRRQFNTSGLAHILCVSGLHIMLIVSALSLFFKIILPKNLMGLYLRYILLILICWSIAFIVGLTPSALRVAIMFSILIITKFTSINNDNINILSVTALIFLCVNPMLLFNISFQLSFLAVFGIFIIRDWLYNFIKIKNDSKFAILNKPLFNIATTTSAQFFCFPIIAFNFSNFPILFIISNLIVLPFIQIILISIILLLIFAEIPILNTFLEVLCNLEMTFLMNVAQIIDNLTQQII